MGYSRGANGRVGGSKMCAICFATFPDAEDRKIHYRKYQCRDDMGNLGGMVVTGRCAAAAEKNREVIRQTRLHAEEEPIEPEDIAPLFVASQNGDPKCYFVNTSVFSPEFSEFALSSVCHYAENANFGIRNPLDAEREKDWDIMMKGSHFDNSHVGLGANQYSFEDSKTPALGSETTEELLSGFFLKKLFVSKGSVPQSDEKLGTFVPEKIAAEPQEEEIFVSSPKTVLTEKKCIFPASVTQTPYETISFGSCFLGYETKIQAADTFSDTSSETVEELSVELPLTLMEEENMRQLEVALGEIFLSERAEALNIWYERTCERFDYWMEFVDPSEKKHVYNICSSFDGTLKESDAIASVLKEVEGTTILEIMRYFPFEEADNFLVHASSSLKAWASSFSYEQKRLVFETSDSFQHWEFENELHQALAAEIQRYKKFSSFSQLKNFIKRKFKNWILLSKGEYEEDCKVASGFFSFPYKIVEKIGEKFGAGLTEGFLGTLKKKLQSLFGPIWETCSFVSNLFTGLLQKALDWVSLQLEKHPMFKLAAEGLAIFCAVLFVLSGLRMLYSLAGSLGLCSVMISAVFIGIFVFFLHKYCDYKKHDAIKRAQCAMEKFDQVWDETVRPTSESLEQDTEILGEASHIIDLSDLFNEEQSAIVASGTTWFLDMAAFWKIVLLLVPVSTMGFAKTLASAKDLTILYGGKEAASKMFQEIISGIQELFYTATGRKNEFLSVLGTFSRIDFEKWREEVALFSSCTTESLTCTPEERLRKLRQLKDQAQVLLGFMDPKVIPSAFVTAYSNTCKILDEAIKVVQVALSVGEWKKQPFCIWLYGDSGVGKSQGAKYFIEDLLNALEYPHTGRVYPRTGSDQYWSGYKNQPVVLYDDLGAIQEGNHFDEAELMKLIAPTPVCLNMADLGSKGDTIFTSDFVVVTANQKGLSPGAVVHNLPAFENRRHFAVEVLRNPNGGQYRERYKFRFFQKNTPYTSGMEEFDYSEILEQLVNAAKTHLLEQERLVASGEENLWDFFERACQKEVEQFLLGYDLPIDRIASIINVYLEIEGRLILKNGTTFLPNEREFLALESLKKHFSGLGIEFLTSAVPKNLRRNALVLLAGGRNEFQALALANGCGFWLQYYFKHNHQSFSEQISRTGGFIPHLSGLYAFLKDSWLSLPFWVKMLVGAVGFFVTGPMLASSFSKLFSVGKIGIGAFFGTSATLFASGASMASSGDPHTPKIGKKDRQSRFILEGSGMVENHENLLNADVSKNLLHQQLLFVSLENPSFDFIALALGGTKILINYHVWCEVNSGAYKVFSLAKEKFVYTIRQSRCTFQRIGKKDVGVCTLEASFPAFPASALKFFPSTYELPVCGFSKMTLPILDESGSCYIQEIDCKNAFQRSKGTYDSRVVKGLECPDSYRCTEVNNVEVFSAKQCGMLLIGWFQNKPVVLGFHYARIRNSGAGSQKSLAGFFMILSRAEISSVLDNLGDDIGPLQEDLLIASGYGQPEFEHTGMVKSLGVVDCKDRPTFPTKTSIKPSLISKWLIENVRSPATEPAVLCDSDPRMTSRDFSILEKGMKKYDKVADDMMGIEKDEELDFEDALDEVFEPLGNNFELVSDEINLNGEPGIEYVDGIVASTSEGYPLILERQFGETGKWRYLDGVAGSFSIEGLPFQERVNRLEETAREQIPCLVGIDCPKDERLPLRKTRDDIKSRLFTVLPFEYNFLVRRYFLRFVADVMQRHNSIPTKVGINPMSAEWDNLYMQLKQKGDNWANGDYSSFDGITPSRVILGIVDRIAARYGGRYKKIQRHLMLAATYRLGISGKFLYRVSGGIPSGFALTVIINSLVNEFFLRFSWKRLVRSAGYLPSLMRMNDHVAFAVYGDDNIFSVSDEAMTFFSLKKVSLFLKGFGVTLKDGSDKTKEDIPDFNPPERCDFLKRRMIPYGSRVLAPLDAVSREERLFWVRDSDLGDMEAIRENISSFLAEAFMEGKEYYVKWLKLIREASYACNIQVDALPTWYDQELIFLGAKMPVELEYDNVIIKRSERQEIAPGIFVMGNFQLRDVWKDDTFCYVWCGQNFPALYARQKNFFLLESLAGKKYPSKYYFKKTFRVLVKERHRKICFTGLWDQDLVYVAAMAYASYSGVPGYSFTKAVSSFFDDEREATRAITSVIGI